MNSGPRPDVVIATLLLCYRYTIELVPVLNDRNSLVATYHAPCATFPPVHCDATRETTTAQHLSSAVLALYKQKLAFLVPRPVFVLKKNISFNFLAGLPTLLCLCKQTAADCLSGNRFIKGTTSLFPETYLGENLLLLAAIHSVPNAYYASVPTIAPSTNTPHTFEAAHWSAFPK